MEAEDSRRHEATLLGWAVAANVAETIRSGSGGRRGTPHFSPGTKLWIAKPRWGDGGRRLLVVGKHRGSPAGVVRMVLERRHLTNFRAAPVYSPAVHRKLTRSYGEYIGAGWPSQEEAERVAASWTGGDAAGWGRPGNFVSLVEHSTGWRSPLRRFVDRLSNSWRATR